MSSRCVLAALLLAAGSALAAESGAADPDPVPSAGADTLHLIPYEPATGGLAKTDAEIFAGICGCINKRVTVRRDSPDFSPVSWSVHAPDGRRVRPREQRGSGSVVLDMSAHERGVYLIVLRDRDGRVLARPLRVE